MLYTPQYFHTPVYYLREIEIQIFTIKAIKLSEKNRLDTTNYYMPVLVIIVTVMLLVSHVHKRVRHLHKHTVMYLLKN